MRPSYTLASAAALMLGLYAAIVTATDLRPIQRVAQVESRLGDLGDRIRLRLLGPPEPVAELLQTGLLVLSKETLLLEPRPGNYGGGWLSLGDRLYLVGAKGTIAEYLGGGQTRPVQVRAPINYDDFESAIAGTDLDFWEARAHFRVVDAYGRRLNDEYEVTVLHNYWDVAERRKRVRLSRMVVDSPDSFEAGVGGWTTLLDCKTTIEPSAVAASPFATNRSGGRIAEDGSGRLLVAFGDHFFDGVDYSTAPATDPDGCFGKVLRMDTTTGTRVVFAEGLRNPEGLLVDREGRVWETEHGPRGGDELNLLEEGVHYGWPHVTYGTRYEGPPYVWPSNPRQGRHEGYRAPVAAWVPSIGVSNLIQISQGLEEWDGDLLIGSLRAGNLYRGRLVEDRMIILETIPIGHRIRDLIQVEDGTVLLWTDSWAVIELTPRAVALSELLPVPLSESEEAQGLGTVLVECSACHSLAPGQSAAAPMLHEVYGRSIAATDYPYSQALRAKGGEWTTDQLRAFIKNPSEFAPGTTMPQTGLDDVRVQLVVDYLARLN